MKTLEENLRILVEKTCSHRPGSRERQRGLTQIIRTISGKIWRENVSYYEDALQKTWLYFCRNLCEATTSQAPYNPEQGTVITWLNAYLKRRLQDGYSSKVKEAVTKASTYSYRSSSGEEGDSVDPIDRLPGNPDIPPILEAVKNWAENDSSEELRSIHIKGHPKVNAQILILKRLPPEVNWKDLSVEFGISVSSLSSFYQRQCLPRMRQFAQNEGFL